MGRKEKCILSIVLLILGMIAGVLYFSPVQYGMKEMGKELVMYFCFIEFGMGILILSVISLKKHYGRKRLVILISLLGAGCIVMSVIGLRAIVCGMIVGPEKIETEDFYFKKSGRYMGPATYELVVIEDDKEISLKIDEETYEDAKWRSDLHKVVIKYYPYANIVKKKTFWYRSCY